MAPMNDKILYLLREFYTPCIFVNIGPANRGSFVFNYSSNNVFGKFLSFKVASDGFELPVFGGATFGDFIIGRYCHDNPVDKIVVSVVPATAKRFVKGYIDTLKVFTNDAPAWYSSFERISYNDIIYYGKPGIILDANFKILVFITLDCTINGGENKRLHCYRRRVYIHPSVMYSNNPIEKFWRTKVLPYVCGNGINGFDEFGNPTESVIIIKDVTKDFLYDTKQPDVACRDEDINKFLKENINMVRNVITW